MHWALAGGRGAITEVPRPGRSAPNPTIDFHESIRRAIYFGQRRQRRRGGREVERIGRSSEAEIRVLPTPDTSVGGLFGALDPGERAKKGDVAIHSKKGSIVHSSTVTKIDKKGSVELVKGINGVAVEPSVSTPQDNYPADEVQIWTQRKKKKAKKKPRKN